MVAIGSQLLRDGYDVVISLAEPYVPIAEAAGLRAVSLFSQEIFDTTLADPNVWKPFSGAKAVLKWVAEHFLRPHFDLIRREHLPGRTVLVSHPLDLASRLHRDFDPDTPLVDIHLAPAILRVPESPPRLMPWKFEIRRPAWAVAASYWLGDRFVLDPIIRRSVNELRAELALKPISRVLDQWWLSPDCILGLYPEWFAKSTSKYKPRLKHAGFPLADFGEPLNEAVTDRPIVFTGGTANHHCKAFFQQAANICQRLDHPGILLSTHSANFPENLPPQVRTRNFIPLGALLPNCAAIVHHGGVGTMSQALAAGTPQLIRAMAFDQFDNASRVQELGCGRWIKNDRDLESELQRCLSGAHQSACSDVSEMISRMPKAIEVVSKEIENTRRDHPITGD